MKIVADTIGETLGTATPSPDMTTAQPNAHEKVINDVRRTLLNAKMWREAWELFYGEHPQRTDILSALNCYVNFFGVMGPAVWIAYIISLSSLFDEDRKAIALSSVPGIKNEPAYAALLEKGRVLFRYRSKLIAHRDAGSVEQNFAKESGLTTDILKWILDTSCQYFNAAAFRLNIDPVPPLSCEGDLLSLVDYINLQFPRARTPDDTKRQQ